MPADLRDYSVYLTWLQGCGANRWTDVESKQELEKIKKSVDLVSRIRNDQLRENARKAKDLQDCLSELYESSGSADS